jgi:5-methylcytosine-specific restriction protein A
MARRPLRLCARPGCGKRTRESYCDQHRRAHNWEDDRQRGTRQERGYDKHWLKLRKAFLSENPLCVLCREDGKRTPAQEVDHVIPFKDRHDPKRLDWENLQAVCRRCHRVKTSRQKATRVVVYGPPAAGKTTYVERHAADGSIVWDYDQVLSTIVVGEQQQLPTDLIEPLLAMLDALVQSVRRSGCDREVWIIVTNPSRANHLAEQIDGTLHRCDPGLDECVRRCQDDPARAGRGDELAVRTWYERWTD